MLIGGLLAFSSLGGIVMPLLLGLPVMIVVCAGVQLTIGLLLLACYWLQLKAKASWACLIFAALVWLPNICVCLLTFFSVAK